MLKRVCDRCEKEISNDEFLFRMDCDKMNGTGGIFCRAGIYELCESCFNDFKANWIARS